MGDSLSKTGRLSTDIGGALILMRLSFWKPTGELKTASRIIPIAKHIGIVCALPHCLRRGFHLQFQKKEIFN